MASFKADGLPSPETRTFTANEIEKGAPVEEASSSTVPRIIDPKRAPAADQDARLKVARSAHTYVSDAHGGDIVGYRYAIAQQGRFSCG